MITIKHHFLSCHNTGICLKTSTYLEQCKFRIPRIAQSRKTLAEHVRNDTDAVFIVFKDHWQPLSAFSYSLLLGLKSGKKAPVDLRPAFSPSKQKINCV